MSDTSETTVTKVKRSLVAQFLNTTPSSTSATWSRMGKGITTGTIAYNPSTTTEQYIDEDSATTTLDSYAPALETAQTAYAGNPVFDYVDGLRKSRAVGSAADTQLMLVYMYDYTESSSTRTYAAELQNVNISITDFGGDAGGAAVCNYTVNFVGDPQIGTATITSGVPTFTAAT